jgi:Xaa-Pro aminopeptidase
VFAERRQKVREAMGPSAVAIFLGAPLVIRSHDTPYPFRQDSNFWYLTGFDHPSAAAVLRTDGGPDYTLYVEPRDPATEIWTGYRPGTEGALRDYGADEAFTQDQLLEHVPELVGKVERIYHVLGRNLRVDATITETIEALHRRSRQGTEPPEAIIDPRGIVHEMRLIKEPAELDVMRRAAAISAEAHSEAARLAHAGAYEYELEAVIEYNFRRGGAERVGFPSIVGAGPNSVVLHYDKSRRRMEDGDLVVMDIGAEYSYYSADVTRTIPVSGRFTSRQREIYDLVLGAQEAAFAAVKPGNTLMDVERAARLYFQEHGAGKCGAKSCNDQFPHGVSHWLGMDVHDVGDYSVKLAPGMLLTVEPGIYLVDEGIGVRIEDDVLVTETGYELLSNAPRDPDEIEELMAEAATVSR